MYINDADAKVFGNSSTFISGCTAGDDGGAVYTPKMAQLDGFIFADNHAEDNGGAIYNESTWAATSTISNCRFYRNSSGEEGGADPGAADGDRADHSGDLQYGRYSFRRNDKKR